MTHTPKLTASAEWIYGETPEDGSLAKVYGNPDLARRLAHCHDFFRGRPIETENIPEGGFWEIVNALDEIANGAPWVGPASDHVIFMRGVAEKVLTKLGVEP